MKRSQTSGNAFRIAGAVLILIGCSAWILATLTLMSSPPPLEVDSDNPAAVRAQALIDMGETTAAIVFMGAGIGVTLVGFLVFRYGRRHVIELASDAPHTATRDMILYLRDFGSDRVSGFGRASVSSEEEQLMKALRRIGKPIAVGRPGENLPQIGAPRIYYNDNEWRDRVGELIRVARLVVIRTGTTDGLRWEVEYVVRSVRPEQLLLVISDTASFQAFRTLTASLVQWPSTNLQFKRAYGLSIRGFVIFDPHWSPTYIQLKRVAILRSGPFQYREFRSALKPVLKVLAG